MAAPDSRHALSEAQQCLDEIARALDRAMLDASKLEASDMVQQITASQKAIGRAVTLLAALRAMVNDCARNHEPPEV